LIVGDSQEKLKDFESESVDLIVTDPPYGYSFMGKDWDKAVPSVDIWKQCLRVLKPGAFAFIMSAPRLDVLTQMSVRVQEAGFDVSFTPLFWAYASGFPKAMNISKAVDKRLGAERETISGTSKNPEYAGKFDNRDSSERIKTGEAITPEAKALDGSYAGFQPKPAVEVIIVAMKPLSERTYIDQALANGKGITWLDDGRISINIDENLMRNNNSINSFGHHNKGLMGSNDGRFPANLLVSDDVLDDYSRYFSLDKWAEQLPFLIVPKASKSEKNKGLDDFEERKKWLPGGGGAGISDRENVLAKNFHPTVKPLKLMSYLITLGSRPGDTILDPFAGSGTTLLAAKNLNRDYIGIELNPEYAEIINARLGESFNGGYSSELIRKPRPQRTIFDFAG